MHKFSINQKSHEFELGYGSYNIFFTGGWYIENLNELNIQLIDKLTRENIKLISKDFLGLRKQDYIENKQAVVAFSFDINKYSDLRLTINNPESLIMKRYHPFLFLFNLVFSRSIPIENINVVIK